MNNWKCNSINYALLFKVDNNNFNKNYKVT